MNELVTETTTHTELSTTGRIDHVASGLYYGVAAHTQIKSAAHSAVGANSLHLACRIFDSLRYEGSNRTPLNAFPTRDTGGFLQRFCTKGADPEVVAPICHVNSVNAHDFAAGPNAYPTLDALVGIEIKKRIARVNRQVLG